ncbi:hypothetical protein PVAP13_9NG232673 [Panicum virgatum]|uniref:FAD-binding domain-containing protein n=1 Tax=Panicum virgatum TaxID=38727 RepID=A0A8T0MHR2_PANVG|nr:hypothetical protein PVAP13_9NG232673 [Panicum virgatum]
MQEPLRRHHLRLAARRPRAPHPCCTTPRPSPLAISLSEFRPGPKITDPAALKSEALDLVRGWPSDLLAVMQSTPEGAVVRTPLVDRWLWLGQAPSASRGGCVVLAGDAWQPMTPNLGQGACCALEDAVVLASRLAPAVGHGSSRHGGSPRRGS